MKKCAKIQIFKIKHPRIENLGQKWRMRFFMAKNQLFFEIKLPLTYFLKQERNRFCEEIFEGNKWKK